MYPTTNTPHFVVYLSSCSTLSHVSSLVFPMVCYLLLSVVLLALVGVSLETCPLQLDDLPATNVAFDNEDATFDEKKQAIKV